MNKQPSSLHCYVCGVDNPHGLGMKFYDTGPGEVRAEYTVPARFQGYPGIVHGGVIAAMLDEVSSRACMQEWPTQFMVTARLSIRYRRPVPVETPLVLLGHAQDCSGRVANVTGEIYGPDGAVLAEAEAVLARIPDNVSLQTDPVEAAGWRVYPDEEEAVP